MERQAILLTFEGISKILNYTKHILYSRPLLLHITFII
jgi:hypothetical protein